MAEGMTACRLRHTGLEDSPLHRPLHHARIEMVAALGTGFPVAPAVLLGKLPGPLPASASIAQVTLYSAALGVAYCGAEA
jgi:hypothetical protein